MPPLKYIICLSPKESHIADLFKPYDHEICEESRPHEILISFTIPLNARSLMLYPFDYRVVQALMNQSYIVSHNLCHGFNIHHLYYLCCEKDFEFLLIEMNDKKKIKIGECD